jgi:hypothetical protein
MPKPADYGRIKGQSDPIASSNSGRDTASANTVQPSPKTDSAATKVPAVKAESTPAVAPAAQEKVSVPTVTAANKGESELPGSTVSPALGSHDHPSVRSMQSADSNASSERAREYVGALVERVFKRVMSERSLYSASQGSQSERALLES